MLRVGEQPQNKQRDLGLLSILRESKKQHFWLPASSQHLPNRSQQCQQGLWPAGNINFKNFKYLLKRNTEVIR